MPREIITVSDERVKPGRYKFDQLEGDSCSEWYSIKIDPDFISVQAYSDNGFMWADRTLMQLVDSDGKYPQVEITDWPEFAIRGFMYDSGRNYLEVKQLRHLIDLCADYKLNVFHWHLTDKPAWRIECHSHPELNDPKHQRPGREEGRFYTYKEIRHIYNYAKDKGMLVIPEIDMPGHSDYFTAACGKPMNSKEGMKILSECLDEFFNEFSAEEMPYIHIGSDEISINNPDEFMDWAITAVEKAGRTPIVWDPGLPGGDRVVYQSWRGGTETDKAVNDGKRRIDSHMGYLNVVDPIMLCNRIFLHTPCFTGKGSDTNLGGILCLWNDVRVDDDWNMPIQNGFASGLLAFAERYWRGGSPAEPFADVMRAASDPDMQALMEFQSRMAAHQKTLGKDMAYWHPNRPTTEWQQTICNAQGEVLHQGAAYGDMVDFNAICAKLGIKDAATATITRHIYCDSDRVAMCRIGFEAPPRSDRISDGIPENGKWENFGTVTVNGKQIDPPAWKEPGKYQFHYHTWAKPEEEIPYTDEQLYWLREPVEIHLQKGDNEITLSTRKHFPEQRFQAAILGLD